MTTVEEGKQLICELCRLFYDQGWVSGTGGGISVKCGDQIVMVSVQVLNLPAAMMITCQPAAATGHQVQQQQQMMMIISTVILASWQYQLHNGF
jgi:ribulose-5-phosphate 4-epimerase/fuculose-1-phosphate aldolase